MATDQKGFTERRKERPIWLSDADIDRIAEAAATKAQAKILNDFYSSVGKSVVRRTLVTIGILAVLATSLLKGWITIKPW